MTPRLRWGRALAALACLFVSLCAGSAQAATFSVLSSKLTQPAGRMALRMTGPQSVPQFVRDTTVTLPDGTYTISSPEDAAPLGTFTP